MSSATAGARKPKPKPETLPSHTYDAGQIAAMLHVERTTVLEWARCGAIPRGRRFGKHTIRWTPEDLAPLLAGRSEG
jgi:hypothetical protein